MNDNNSSTQLGSNNEGDGVGRGNVDLQIPFASPGSMQVPATRDATTGRFLPGQSGNPAGKQSLANLTQDFRRKLLAKNFDKAADVASKWLQSGDPFVQKLYFEYIVGKPKHAIEPVGGQAEDNDPIVLAMREEAKAKALEARVAELESMVNAKVIDVR